MRSSAPRSRSCRSSPIFTRNGRNAGSASITTSKSSGIITPCRTRCCARRCGHGSRRAPSRSSIAAIGSRLICDRHRTGGTPRCVSTCRAAIGAMPTGRRSGSDGRPARSGAIPPCWSRPSCASALTRSKDSGPRSASSVWSRAMAATGWRQPAAGPWRSGRAPSPPPTRSGKTTSKPNGPPLPRTGRRLRTPTSVAPVTSTEENTMLTHPTLDQLKALNLDGMAGAFVELQNQAQAAELSHAEWLALLLDREAANRNTRRFQIRLRSAKLRHSQAVIEDVDYRTPRRLDKALFQQLTAGKWIAEHRNLLVTGPCGIGKSLLACALAQKACRDGYTVVYARVPRLFADLELAHGDGRFTRLFRTLVKADLLVLDDWGPERPTASQRRDLMEIVEDRHGNGSTLITSQLPRDKWHDIIGEPNFADAILDRIVHNAYRLEFHRPHCVRARIGRTIHAQAPSQRCFEKLSARGPRATTREGSSHERSFTRHQTSKERPEMTAVPSSPPAPVGQQGPPARAAAPAVRALRVARGSLLLTTGTVSRRA